MEVVSITAQAEEELGRPRTGGAGMNPILIRVLEAVAVAVAAKLVDAIFADQHS
jgi:hypothetical protein